MKTKIYYEAHLEGTTERKEIAVSAHDIESIMLTIDEMDGTIDEDGAEIEVYAFECDEYGYQSIDDGQTTYEIQY